MGKYKMRDLVGAKIESETECAQEIANNLRKKNATITRQSIREFFPHHEDRWGQSRSNLPGGIPFAMQIIYGRPTTFDLYPESRFDFERRYGIDLHAAISLSEQGRLLPNLYVRDEMRWETGCEELGKLVELSTVNGVRVNAHLGMLFPKHPDRIAYRLNHIQPILANLQKQHPHRYSYILDRLAAGTKSDAERALSNRWAYLDSFADDASKVFGELLDSPDLALAMDYLDVLQNLTVSPISGALGGYFVWDHLHLKKLNRVRSSQELYKRAKITGSVYLSQEESPQDSEREVAAFLARYLGGDSALDFVTINTATALVKIALNDHFARLRDNLHAACIQLPIAIDKKQGVEEIARQWIDTVKEMRATLRGYEKKGKISLQVGSVIMGGLTNFLLGVGGGICLALFSEKSKELGRFLHKIGKPQEHQFLATLDQIDKLRLSVD